MILHLNDYFGRENMVVKNINEELCIGCKICVDICTEDVIRFDETRQKPYVKYPRDCVACTFCEAICPVGAIDTDLTRPRKLPEVI